MEKQRVEFLLTQNAAKFPKGEERKEGAEDDDRPGERLLEVELVQDRSRRLAVDEALDELLEEAEEEDEQAEDD